MGAPPHNRASRSALRPQPFVYSYTPRPLSPDPAARTYFRRSGEARTSNLRLAEETSITSRRCQTV